jgi:tRNA(Met) C34 N-acetyltransferase TmcA
MRYHMLEIGRKRVGISISDNISEISEPAWREGESGEEETKNTRSEPEIANQRKRNGEARGQKRSLTETRKSTQPAERAAHVRGRRKRKKPAELGNACEKATSGRASGRDADIGLQTIMGPREMAVRD